jgi:cation transport ATPase
MKKQLVITIMLAAAVFSNAAFAVQTIQAHVNGMVCAFCAQGIEKKMRKLPQTHDVYVNLKQKLVAVELKNGQTLSQDTVKKIIKDAGYDVTTMEMSEHPVAHIKAELESKAEAKNE